MQLSDFFVVAPVIAFITSIIGLFLHAIDTFFQWRAIQDKSKRYLWKKVPFLVVVFEVDTCLIAYIECEIKHKQTTWLPALWALVGISMLLSLSVEVRLPYYL
jgi:hypothetical protein